MKKSVKLGIFLGIVGLIVTLAGCSKDAKSIATTEAKVFQSAPAPTKAAWDTAAAAMKINGYVIALVSLQGLRAQPGLTAEQIQAVEKTATAVSDQIYEAA